jgi:hypothetical protein
MNALYVSAFDRITDDPTVCVAVLASALEKSILSWHGPYVLFLNGIFYLSSASFPPRTKLKIKRNTTVTVSGLHTLPQ